MKDTVLYQLTEHSPFMMSFVIVTGNGKLIVVDGGRESDMPYLMEFIGGKTVAAWFLTHPHMDHISGFIHLVKEGSMLNNIEKVYYNFHSVEFIEKYEAHEADTIREFMEIEPLIANKICIVEKGDIIKIDEVSIEILYTKDKQFINNAINDSSIVFKLTTPNKSVLFLGDLGPEGGEKLLAEKKDKLKSDIVQIAHHGHMCVEEDVYAAIEPEACMWCAADWLYNEEDRYIKLRMYGTMRTRKWMDKLGVKTHFVTKDGTQTIEL